MIYIGTTGWDYEWWNGSFYPAGQEDRLSYFSKIASFTEIRSTFFKLPSETIVHEWSSNTPDSFIFSAKMLKQVTHNAQFDVSENTIKNFFDRLQSLSSKLGLVLLQFPVKLQKSPKSFEFLLEILNYCNEYFPGKLLVETRNRSWHKEEVKIHLANHNTCLVSTDKRPISAAARDKSTYYLRLMGDKNLIPAKQFGQLILDRESDIKNWANHLKFIEKRSKDVFVAFDNHFSGHSAKDAITLSKELKKLHVKTIGFKVKSS